jgi:hypothetical protein
VTLPETNHTEPTVNYRLIPRIKIKFCVNLWQQNRTLSKMLSLAHELRGNDSYTLPDRTRPIFTRDHRTKSYLKPYHCAAPWRNGNKQRGRRRRTHRTAEGPRHLHGDVVCRSSAPTRSPSRAPSSTSSTAPSSYCSRTVGNCLRS